MTGVAWFLAGLAGWIAACYATGALTRALLRRYAPDDEPPQE